jgi:protein-S-isoprenylcysteine O-methyltransferase Ste14
MSYGSMAAARTTIDPSEHSSKVVTSGLYAYSRNPIYLGWFLLIAGIGFRNASGLVLAIAVTMVLLLYWAVIVEEEAYLEKKFGEEYIRYKKRVRRWL